MVYFCSLVSSHIFQLKLGQRWKKKWPGDETKRIMEENTDEFEISYLGSSMLSIVFWVNSAYAGLSTLRRKNFKMQL